MDDETLTNIDNLITPSLMKHSNWLESYIPTRANPLGTIASEHSTIGQAIAAIKSATLEATLGLNDRHSTIDQALAAIKSSALEATLDLNDRHSTIGQAIAAIKSAKLETTLGLNATKLVDIRNLDISSLQEELGRSDQQQFNEVNDIGSFIKIINSLPSLLQDIFYYLFIYVVIAQINSISANLLTPFVESYLKDNKSAERIQIKTIKRIPLSLGDVDTDGLRFIAGNNVRLRSESSTRSEVLDELVLGQIVTVLSKSRNWIEVKYEYEDGDAVSGWVFTRYTAKFVK